MLQPQYIYATLLLGEGINFYLDKNKTLEELYKKPYKICFLLEHKHTFDQTRYFKALLEYQMSRGKCIFYPENQNLETFLPDQLWFPVNTLSFLQNKVTRNEGGRKVPTLYFSLQDDYPFLNLCVDKKPILRPALLSGQISFSFTNEKEI